MKAYNKVFGYCRVSSIEQGAADRASLPAQAQAVQGVALVHGFEVAAVYQDVAVSGGTPLADRPEGSKLVAELQPGTLVIASKLDRLFRSASDALGTVEAWAKRGVDLVLVDCGVEPISSNGASKLFFSILASVAEFEKGRIAERTQEGKRAKRARGGHVGGSAPFGYRVVGEGRAAALVPEPGEQTVVDQIKALRAEGLSLRKLAVKLTEQGILTRAGTAWSAVQVGRVLGQKTAAHFAATVGLSAYL